MSTDRIFSASIGFTNISARCQQKTALGVPTTPAVVLNGLGYHSTPTQVAFVVTLRENEHETGDGSSDIIHIPTLINNTDEEVFVGQAAETYRHAAIQQGLHKTCKKSNIIDAESQSEQNEEDDGYIVLRNVDGNADRFIIVVDGAKVLPMLGQTISDSCVSSSSNNLRNLMRDAEDMEERKTSRKTRASVGGDPFFFLSSDKAQLRVRLPHKRKRTSPLTENDGHSDNDQKDDKTVVIEPEDVLFYLLQHLLKQCTQADREEQRWSSSTKSGGDCYGSSGGSETEKLTEKNRLEKHRHQTTTLFVSIPDHFSDSQRHAVRDVCSRLSPEIMTTRLFSHTNALTARDYLHPQSTQPAEQQQQQQCGDESLTLSVYIGGSHVDVSVLTVDDGVEEVRSIHSDPSLGGSTFTRRIASYFLEDGCRILAANILKQKKGIVSSLEEEEEEEEEEDCGSSMCVPTHATTKMNAHAPHHHVCCYRVVRQVLLDLEKKYGLFTRAAERAKIRLAQEQSVELSWSAIFGPAATTAMEKLISTRILSNITGRPTASLGSVVPSTFQIAVCPPISISREFFENVLCADLWPAITQLCSRALAVGGCGGEALRRVLIGGGGSLMPKVIQLLTELLKGATVCFDTPSRRLERTYDTQKALPLTKASLSEGPMFIWDGFWRKGSTSTRSTAVSNYLHLAKCPYEIGFAAQGGGSGGIPLHITPIFPIQPTVPAKKSFVVTTAKDNQASVTLDLFHLDHNPASMSHKARADFHLASPHQHRFCKRIAVLHVSAIMPAPRQVPQIHIDFDLDVNGTLSAYAYEGSGRGYSLSSYLVKVGTAMWQDGRIDLMSRKTQQNHSFTDPSWYRPTDAQHVAAPSFPPSTSPVLSEEKF